MKYFCCDDHRRQTIRTHGSLNGIDFLEVSEDLRTLSVHFLKHLTIPFNLGNLRIDGGQRIRNLHVTNVAEAAPDILKAELDRAGDFSTYTLSLVRKDTDPWPFDPIASRVEFSFKAGCPSNFDCEPQSISRPNFMPQPEIDYLAKDYASFRRLMLDRLTTLMPEWQQTTPADMGIALVELLAYVGDYLSYQQDAAATEAYLETARRRVSVRRHARLVDYRMHDGANARVWVHVRVSADGVFLKQGTKVFTRVLGADVVCIPPDSPQYRQVMSRSPEVFETMHGATLHRAHNQIDFYTWGARECCLPAGATRATLRGDFPDLEVGDVLIFKEILGPRTGDPADADPAHCQAVRLTQVEPGKEDPLGGRFLEQANDDPVPVTEIQWAAEDALPFPICISGQTQEGYRDRISAALGNIILADHGQRVTEKLPVVPHPRPELAGVSDQDDRHCHEGQRLMKPPRFRPRLQEGPITCAAPYDHRLSASRTTGTPARDALPVVTLHSNGNTGAPDTVWRPQWDLLASSPRTQEFVAEIETDGTAYLRFGDNQFGRRPAPGLDFTAAYRVGNGIQGNIGAEALAHMASSDDRIEALTNPLPARGGTEPEPIEEVRQTAPFAFRTQERAVTPEDYAMVAGLHPGVQRAAAALRWTGSWHTVFLSVDRLGGLDVNTLFKADLRSHLEKYRLAGHDLEIVGPRYVPLKIHMNVCVRDDYFRSDVKEELVQLFSSGLRQDGRRGVFHPDNFTFGQTVYLSPLYAAAERVEGLASVHIKEFRRQGYPIDDTGPLEQGKLLLDPLEIACLDNNPNFPERGLFELTLEGGT